MWVVHCRWRQTDSIRKTDTHLQSEVTLESWISRQITVWQTGLLWEQIMKQSQGLLLCHKGMIFSNSPQCCKDGVLMSKSKHSNSLINTMTLKLIFPLRWNVVHPFINSISKFLSWTETTVELRWSRITAFISLYVSMKYICSSLSVMLFTVWVDKGSCFLLLEGGNFFYLKLDRTQRVEVPQYNQ